MRSPFTSFTDPAARPALIFLILLAVTLAAFLFLVGLGPESLPFPPEAGFSDAVISHWPNALFLRRAVLEDHTWPLWRPLLMSGQPFAANPLNKVWYPLQWLVLVFPPILHLNLLTWLHLVLAGVGAWTWGRATGLAPWPAALVGFAYAFAPRLIASVGAGHLDLVYAAAWFPWLLWAVHRLVQPAPARRSSLVLAGVAALCFLADVRLSAYAFVTAGAYLIWQWTQTPELRSRTGARRLGMRVLVAALLVVGLTAFQWVPLLMQRSELSRGGITLDEAAAGSLTPGRWLGLLIGDHGGSWEVMVYVGVSTLALAVVALLMQPRRFALWGGLLLVIALYAMGDHFVLWTVLNRWVPALRWWRVPPRAWLVAALILPYLAGWGAQLLAERPPDRRAVRLGIVALFGGGMVCGLFSTISLSAALDLTATLGTFALPAAALIMLLAISGKLSSRGVMLAFALVVLADVLWIDRTLIDGRDRREWLDPYRPLAEYLQQDGAVRVYSPSYSLPQQAGAYWEIPQFGGIDPFQLQSYVDVAEAATGVRANGYSITIPAYERDDADDLSAEELLATANQAASLDAKLLAEWLVTHVVSAFEIETDGLELVAQIGEVYVYRNTYAPAVTLDWHGPNRVTIRAAQPYTGTLYAVAGGQWQAERSSVPGLPGPVEAPSTSWTYRYSWSEVRWAALAAGLLIALAALLHWSVIRD